MENHHQKATNGFSKPTDYSTAGRVITCKAAVVWVPGEPFVMEQVQVDPPQKLEVRIKILFTSICHTDLSAWLGENEAQRAFPRILGHEASGIVESVGEGVMDIKEGDHVVPIFNGECGECKCCKSEKTNICSNSGVNGFKKIDPEAPMKKMTLLSCGVSTGVGAAWNTANVQPASTVAIFGLGSVGLAVAEGARARGASKIIGVDINPDKSIKGQEMGVTNFINPTEPGKPVHERIREITDGGVDYSFECVGNLDVLREAFLSTHEGWGFTVILGIHAAPTTLPFHPMELFNGRGIIGSVFGGFKGKSQLPHFAKQCMRGVVGLDKFITHELPFEKINDAFQLLIEGKSLRCVLQL
ncbi:hypothetical protein ACFX13_039217 [Malus domestica]